MLEQVETNRWIKKRTLFHAATCSSDHTPGALKESPEALWAMKVASLMIRVPGMLARAE
jgi:hypothetical protein